MSIESFLRGVLGVLIILGSAFLLSNNKKKVNWRLVGGGLAIQVVFSILILKGDFLRSYFFMLGWPIDFFRGVSYFFVLILNFTTEGASFVFGPLAKQTSADGGIGFIFAFQVLPTIIFFASLMSVLYYLGIMQRIVQAMAWVMLRLMGTSGAESLSCTANIFVGQTEAPLMIKPFVKTMTNSELLSVMVGGMATIAGGVMAAYIQILSSTYAITNNIPLQQAQLLFATHLLGASCMAAPAALLISKIIYPETGEPDTKGSVKIKIEQNSSNVIEAAATGAADGLMLAFNVGGMLIAFIALIALLNYALVALGGLLNVNDYLQHTYGKPLNMQFILGFILQWLAVGVGVPWHEAMNFGSLIGTKVVLNEFVAYLNLSEMMNLKQMTDPKAIFMATYALCGFANFSSIAIQIGGIGPMAPERKSDLAKLGIRAVIGGSLSTLMTATLAGILF